MSWLARTEIDGVIRAMLADRGIGYRVVGDWAYDVRLVNDDGLVMAVRLVVGAQSLLAEAFFTRRPAGDAAALYRLLLERNGHMFGAHFAINNFGDVYLMGQLPLVAVTPAEIERLLDSLVGYADAAYAAASGLGLDDQVRREWDSRSWRRETQRAEMQRGEMQRGEMQRAEMQRAEMQHGIERYRVARHAPRGGDAQRNAAGSRAPGRHRRTAS